MYRLSASRKAYFQLELLIIWTTTLARQQLHHHFMEQGYPSSSFLQRVILVRDVSQSQYFLLAQTSIQFLTARQLSHQLNLRQQLHQSQKGKCMRSIAQQKCSTLISPGLKTLQSGFFGWKAENNVIGNQYFIGLMECQKCLLEKSPPSVWKNR